MNDTTLFHFAFPHKSNILQQHKHHTWQAVPLKTERYFIDSCLAWELYSTWTLKINHKVHFKSVHFLFCCFKLSFQTYRLECLKRLKLQASSIKQTAFHIQLHHAINPHRLTTRGTRHFAVHQPCTLEEISAKEKVCWLENGNFHAQERH